LDDRFLLRTLSNGVVVLGERMRGVGSAAMTLLVPAGAAVDPAGAIGSATVLSEWALRGAGVRDSRALSDHLDRLGLQRSSGAGLYHVRYACAAPAERVMEALPVYADIVQRPLLPDAQFEPARELALQALAGLADDPRSRVLIKLRQLHWPAPFSRNSMGEEADLGAMTAPQLRAHHASAWRPAGMILAVAGAIDFAQLEQIAIEQFATMSGQIEQPIETAPPTARYHFAHADSEQTHIGIAWPSVPETDPNFYIARLAGEILSGGMSGRLFTEVREKRGLCYSVGASYASLKHRADMLGYAGTTPERAQATLDQFLTEVRRLSEGVTLAELERAKTGLKANIIMSGESTSSRAGAIASDYFARGIIRTLDEIKSAIDAVTLDRINAWLAATPPGEFTIAVVGPKELKLPE
jgi:predicted Zn-dependent peptidase